VIPGARRPARAHAAARNAFSQVVERIVDCSAYLVVREFARTAHERPRLGGYADKMRLAHDLPTVAFIGSRRM
jgi:hypothetical protein